MRTAWAKKIPMFIAKEDKATERRNAHQAEDGERKVGRVALFFHCFFFLALFF